MQIERITSLPVVAMRGIVVLPGDTISFDVGRSKSIKAVHTATAKNGDIGLFCQKPGSGDDPSADELFSIGTFCSIKQVIRLPKTETVRVIAEATNRIEVVDMTSLMPCFEADVYRYIDDNDCDPMLFEALRRRISALISEVSTLGGKLPPDQLEVIENTTLPGQYADCVALRLLTNTQHRQSVLETLNVTERLTMLHSILSQEIEIMRLDRRIESETKQEIDRSQREFYLREKMKVIKDELGEDEDEAEKFREQMSKKELPDYARDKLKREIDRFSALPPYSHEAPSTRAFIECALELPWTEISEDNVDLAAARAVLDRDHYGLDKVKDRIIEYLAVAKHTGSMSGQIICFVGPPGVGKTSISSSIAEAVGRSFVRMSLGGIDDEAEIRGHRRTYIGAMPGRIIAAMRQSKHINPIILLDEIDKLNKNVHGDPAAALLEVLDGAQNATFRDHFLEIPYDLSKVMFITTANTRETIPRPLLDRMEIVEVPGYLETEKLQIATRHLLPKQMSKHALTKSSFTLPTEQLSEIVRSYTRESGVRQLERLLASVCRKVTKELDGGKSRIKITSKKLHEYLGAPIYVHDEVDSLPTVGLCTGLAWTEVGGETLSVEVCVTEGTGKLELTGKLGDVMKESASAALTYVRSVACDYALEQHYFTTHDIHVHVPEGAVPKDGPSAGVTMMTAILSAITGTPIMPRLAMTGEITLSGRVLRIGGLREKLLAALRAGVKTVVVPQQNHSDVLEIEQDITSGLRIVYAAHASDVLAVALMKDESAAYISSAHIPSFASPITTGM